MATELQLRSASVKQRSIWAWLGFTIITLGIYAIVWFYKVNKEMKEIGAAYGNQELATSNPAMSTLAMFIPIANLFAIHSFAQRVRLTQGAVGRPVDYSVGVHWILALFTGLWPLYAQSALNSCWETGMATANQAPGTAAAMPHAAAV